MQLLTRKNLSEVKEAKGHTHLKRDLGSLDLVLLGLGGIIGSGIFVITGFAASQFSGPAITVSFLLGAIACIFTALAFSELAALLPVSGSAYTYCYVTMGRGMAILSGWSLLM